MRTARDHIAVRFDLDTQRRRERGREQLDVADRGEIDEERTELVAPGVAGGDLDGEAGLADPADTGERHQPVVLTRAGPARRARSSRPTIGFNAAGRFDRPKPPLPTPSARS